MKKFLDGLKSSSNVVLAVMYATILFCFLVFYNWVDSGSIWGTEKKHMYSWNHDQISHVNYLIHEIKNAPNDQFNVVILSASSAREAVLLAPAFEKAVENKFGKNIKLFNLAMSDESYAESLQILEAIGRFNGVILLGTSAQKFFNSAEDIHKVTARMNRVPYYTPITNQLLEDNPYFEASEKLKMNLYRQRPFLKVFFWKSTRFYFAKKTEYVQYVYPSILHKKWNEEDFFDEKNIDKQLSGIYRHAEIWRVNKLFLEAIINWAQNYDIPLALFELTTHYSFMDITNEKGFDFKSMYESELNKISEQYDLNYINVESKAKFQPVDFFNYFHVLNKKKEYSQGLIDWVGEIKK